MKTNNAGSAPSTGTASTSGPKASQTESEYLQQQAEKARQAISAVMEDMTSHLMQGVDPRAWAKEYPLATIGSAAVIGFAAAYGLIPSREEQALQKLRELERALALDCPPPRWSADGAARAGTLHAEEYDAQEQKPKGSVLQGFVKHLMSAAGPAVMSALTATVSQAMKQSDDPSHGEQQKQPSQTAPGNRMRPSGPPDPIAG